MLTLILGRAKSGKTAKIMDEIRSHVENCRGSNVLLVPEQYSHEAEMELLRRCGDSLSLYAEVLSFSRLCSRIEAELGRPQGSLLDKSGRLLCMTLALDAVGSRLKMYGSARRQTELQSSLLGTVDEFKSACVSPEQLAAAAQGRSDILGDKLHDLSLIYGAYRAVVAQGRLDPTDRLTWLADNIARSSVSGARFYLDGFTDFTAQERRVIESLLRSGAEITVCLTCRGLEEGHEVFQPSRRAALALQRLAGDLGIDCSVVVSDGEDAVGAMAAVERELFSFGEAVCDCGESVSLHRGLSISAECEFAAAKCVELVREKNCRWRDIAVAVRSYEDYRATLESMFARYGVPLYSAGKSAVSAKPLFTLIASAFEIVSGGWEYEDIFTYLKTGLAGLDRQECDKLENYAFTWSLRGSAWSGDRDWHMHPDGYNGEYTEATQEALREINALRRRIAAPLIAFSDAGRRASTAFEQAQALSDLFDALELPQLLTRRAGELSAMGMERQAAETKQLWDIAVSALEQCAGILGGSEMEQEVFGKLYCLVLSQYDVGTIPMSLDSVSAGDMDRMRRRHIKHLLVLGCGGERVPLIQSGGGIFTDEDREALLTCGMDLGGGADDRLGHEFALIYNCMTLPSETLHVSYCSADGEGDGAPSFVLSRLEKIFSLPVGAIDIDACRTNAVAPALELAAKGVKGSASPLSRAAMKYFSENGEGERLQRLDAAASLTRGQLSRSSVRALYGDKLRLSASRIDKFASCRFAYFLQYGLKAKPRQAAAFNPPEMGTFMHFVLEHVAQEISAMGGFARVNQEQVEALCEKYVGQYVSEVLNDFRDKSARFIYLFRRLTGNVVRVVSDMVAELSRSDFKPLDFELDFDRAGFPPVELGEGEDALTLTGIADRVDGYLHDGKLYIRVVDYKTGWKKFSLSDVWYGMGLQMLLYLFALQKNGSERYGREIVPAGVLYVPARDVLVSAKADMTQEEILSEKAKSLRRSGLLLNDDAVLRAMEHGDSPRYIPVTIKNGVYSGDALASAERLGELSRHIDQTLRELSGQLRRGSIAADPYFRSQTDTACALCDYRAACHFDEEQDCRRYLAKLKPAQVWEKLEGGEDNGL